jgi:hypothetical protein
MNEQYFLHFVILPALAILGNMNRPVVAIYFDNTYFSDNQLTFIDDYYKEAYENLIKTIITNGVDVIITHDAQTNYLTDFQFKSYWSADLDNNKVTFHEVIDRPQSFNLLFDKGQFPFKIDKKINVDKISHISRNKYLSYLFAPDFHAQSYLLADEIQHDIFLELHKDKVVVLKEVTGHGGKQVYVGSAKNYTRNLTLPLLAQCFIDTSDGFPGLAEGVHDIRVALFNGHPIHGLVRQSALGKLKSNFSEGATVRALFIDEIPKDLIERTQEIDRRFDVNTPRFFSADWGFDKNEKTWKLFEINSAPGLALKKIDGPAANEFTNLLAEKLAESANHAAG